MTDLIRRIKQEFSNWYSNRENQAEAGLGNISFQTGSLEIPHPSLKINLLLYQKISYESIDDLLEKPLVDVAEDQLVGSFSGADGDTYEPFFIEPAKETELTDRPSGSYDLNAAELNIYDNFDDGDAVINFIRSLPNFSLSKLVSPYDEKDIGSKFERTEQGVVLTQLTGLGHPRKPILINQNLLDKINSTKDKHNVNSMIKELAGETRGGKDDIDYMVKIAYVTQLYALRDHNHKAAGLMEFVARENHKVRTMSGNFDIADFLTFSDCQYQKWRNLPQVMLRLFDTSLKLPAELTDDVTFLESVAEYAKKRDASKLLLGESFMFTPCARLSSSTGTYFAKQISLPKVPSADYELQTAQRLRDAGFDVPRPVGLAVIRKAPHVVFEYAENAINLLGQDSSYKEHEELAKHLRKQKRQVYTALGQYVRRMFDADIVDTDMATRNFMTEFDNEGNFQRVFQVDFEKTLFLEDDPTLRTVTKRKAKERALREMKSNMTQAEKKYFSAGYKS